MICPLIVASLANAGAPRATTHAARVSAANIWRITAPFEKRCESILRRFTMRQMVITRYGRADVIQPRQAADPSLAAGEIRVAVAAAGVNFADVLARVGLYPDAPKPPVTVGYEVSGRVDAVG